MGGNRPLREVPQQHVTRYETATAPTIPEVKRWRWRIR
ncbi:hypothetical protein L837_1513 [Mycobacterium avium MAV_061107_1842]|nr:hypothetical protein L837_1513 [Mycobacterium avium MAV_061107_1842]